MTRTIMTFFAALLWAVPVLARDMPEDRCTTTVANQRLGVSLPRVADRIARGKSVTVVAIGSSSTSGAGASDAAHSYPSVLEAALGARLYGARVHVVNKGVNGDFTRSMVERFERDVFPHHPQLVIWQVGANAVLRDKGIGNHGPTIRDGIRRLKAAGADVVLMDIQYAPRLLNDPDHADMVALLDRVAAEEHVGLFRRFQIMRSWIETGRMTNEEMLSPDGLHLNDLSYDCIGRLMAQSIMDSAERRTAGMR
ncbi:SGNH/GDSL hydrolase family protein [Desertibaculum subflavum]|uniref:SGNH/GDSL hydrolase family protein n=1 Tax=Desertibaculum subflavum TaxID=2268458 RepID=UPI0013C42F1A